MAVRKLVTGILTCFPFAERCSLVQSDDFLYLCVSDKTAVGGAHVKLVAAPVLALPGPPPSLGLRLHSASLCPALLLPVYLILFCNPQGTRRVFFTHDAQLIPYQPFVTALNPNALRYTLYVISCSPMLLWWDGWLCTILGRIEEAFAQSILCSVVQMKVITWMSKLGFLAPFPQLNKWRRFRDVVVARAPL